MKKLSIILLLVMLVSLLSVSSVFAQTPTPGTGTGSVNVCGFGQNEGQVKNGLLYMFPGFNLREWLKHNPRISLNELVALNPGVSIVSGTQSSCLVIRVPQG